MAEALQRRILEFTMAIDNPAWVTMPRGAQILHVEGHEHRYGCQRIDRLSIWALVDLDVPTEERFFVVADGSLDGDGSAFNVIGKYIDSFLDESMVRYLFEVEKSSLMYKTRVAFMEQSSSLFQRGCSKL